MGVSQPKEQEEYDSFLIENEETVDHWVTSKYFTFHICSCEIPSL